ncbi:hypothetical protein LNP04_01560 [Chryseobacterium sp. C-71]|uniref:helix-turn-helix transcriptional regulator n=1 Tax=Chryseobacterium sp. C-71 TaxID=2893882 RepID=UPI001E50CA6C|nr:hypothetical protein [Chryseobacterium sp. C-71]UFH32422.1 hypothetical protein LNP04_01560 [Chryseobacterium sp. C-71]
MLKSIFYAALERKKITNDEIEYEKSLLFDIYTIVLIFILGCNIFLNIIFLEDYQNATVFLGLTLLMISTLFWPDKIRFKRINLAIIFFFLGIIIFFCDIIGGEGCMNYLSYVSLTIALSFFFNYTSDKYVIFFLIGSYLLWFLINIVTNYSLFLSFQEHLSPEKQWYVRIYKVLEISICTFVGMYFINRKEKMIIKYHLEKERLNNLLEKTDRINFSGELYDLALSKNSLFITYFKSQYPDFFEKILQNSPTIISSELEVCAMLKLNMGTKEIATATNSTIRAIENKKYRIRRKLNISSDTDINLHIINTY